MPRFRRGHGRDPSNQDATRRRKIKIEQHRAAVRRKQNAGRFDVAVGDFLAESMVECVRQSRPIQATAWS